MDPARLPTRHCFNKPDSLRTQTTAWAAMNGSIKNSAVDIHDKPTHNTSLNPHLIGIARIIAMLVQESYEFSLATGELRRDINTVG